MPTSSAPIPHCTRRQPRRSYPLAARPNLARLCRRLFSSSPCSRPSSPASVLSVLNGARWTGSLVAQCSLAGGKVHRPHASPMWVHWPSLCLLPPQWPGRRSRLAGWLPPFSSEILQSPFPSPSSQTRAHLGSQGSSPTATVAFSFFSTRQLLA